MVLYGASGHARVICSVLESKKISIEGIFDDKNKFKNLDTYDILGRYNSETLPDERLIISIGDNVIRKKLSSLIKHQFGIAIHRTTLIDKIVEIGNGSVLMQNVTIQRGTKIGKQCIINTCSSIDHDCLIHDFVHIAPQSTLCGGVEVGEGTLIGANSTIIQNIKIGKWTTIGAGSVIINDVPDFAVVVGNPGRIIKYNRQDAE